MARDVQVVSGTSDQEAGPSEWAGQDEGEGPVIDHRAIRGYNLFVPESTMSVVAKFHGSDVSQVCIFGKMIVQVPRSHHIALA